jgi:hypothetical protein
VRCIATDKPTAGGTGQTKPAQMHCLAAADSESCAKALADCLRNAGLVPKAFIPVPAAMLAASMRMLVERPEKAKAGGSRLVLWIGEHGSVLAAGNAERTAFIRHLPLGVESLVDAMVRPVQGRPTTKLPGTGPDGTTTDRADARAMLFSSGIPRPTGPGEASTGGATILPLIQPVLQKYIVETKQSLRFGLSQPERTGLSLIIAGPGASIAGLAEIIARECGIEVSAQDPAGVSPPPDDLARGDASALFCAGELPINLLPNELVATVSRKRLRAAMWVGAGLAAAAMSLDGAGAYVVLQKEQRTLQSLQQQAAAPNASRAAYEKTRAARRGVTLASQKIDQALGSGPEWAATLSFLAEHTPATIRLREVRAERTLPARSPADGSPVTTASTTCRVVGVVRPEGVMPAALIVKQFIDTLNSAPIFQFAKLGTTQRVKEPTAPGEIEQAVREVLSFEITLGLIELPRSLSEDAKRPGLKSDGLASASGEGVPR